LNKIDVHDCLFERRDDTQVHELPKPVNGGANLTGHDLLGKKKDRPMTRKMKLANFQSDTSLLQTRKMLKKRLSGRMTYRRTLTYVAPTYVDPDLRKKLIVSLPPLQPPPHPPLPQLNTTVTPVSMINYYYCV
jgi:hypothetical protein